MAVSFTNDGRFNIHHLAIWTNFHFFNCHCNSMWNFFVQTAKCLFTDHFRYNLTLRLICDCIFLIKCRSVWKIFKNHFQYRICILSFKCRYRYNIRKFTNIFIGINKF